MRIDSSNNREPQKSSLNLTTAIFLHEKQKVADPACRMPATGQ
jgi:hypothetical protein